MRNIVIRLDPSTGIRFSAVLRSGHQPSAGLQHYISYRYAGPRSKSMVTMEQMTGGYAASQAVPEGGRVSVKKLKPCPAQSAGFPFVW